MYKAISLEQLSKWWYREHSYQLKKFCVWCNNIYVWFKMLSKLNKNNLYFWNFGIASILQQSITMLNIAISRVFV